MEVNLNIESKDIKFLKDFLKGVKSPVEIDELTNQLALFKTEGKLSDKVKIYDPKCDYKVDDLIYKEYHGRIPIGTKKYFELERGVVLRVVEVRSKFKDEIKLKYEGTSDYKKYLDYLTRQKIELLLPHRMEKPCEKPEFLDPELDPRKFYDPLLARDYNNLRKKLIALLNKNADIAFTGNKAILASNLMAIETVVFTKIREFLTDSGRSESTEFFVENFVKIKPESDDFGAYCFALSFKMKNEYKIDFQQVNYEGWGKWNLISVIYYLLKDSIISDENPLLKNVVSDGKKGPVVLRKKFEEKLFDDDNSKYFLSQREIFAGAIRLKQGIYEFDESIEVELVDESTKKTYIGYYYSESNLLMGLKEIFENYKVLQGSIITLSQVEDTVFFFNIRTTKKGTVSEKIEYDENKKLFIVRDDKIASQVFINRSIYLEQKDLIELENRIELFRESNSFNELLNKVFLEFGVRERNFEIHVLKLYHILDLIAPVNLRTVLDVIFGNPAYIPSEKIHGVFYLDPSSIGNLVQEEMEKKTIHDNQVKSDQDSERQNQLDEEKKVDDEIRMIREERRRKREEEMRKVDQIEKDRREKILKEMEPDKKKFKATAERKDTPAVPMDAVPIESDQPTKVERVNKEAAHKKKTEKGAFKPEKEKSTQKRVKKSSSEDRMDMEEIQSEIELLKLKEKVEKDKVKKLNKEKEVAFKDTSGFGGVFASKLDEIAKSDKKVKKGKKEKK
ncbi:MAG: hypothetical protein KAS21_09750 [Candidatus Aminicenantes bacterium]|nr:hypothetical protein [Candidatus Aminicenantes bacterium]